MISKTWTNREQSHRYRTKMRGEWLRCCGRWWQRHDTFVILLHWWDDRECRAEQWRPLEQWRIDIIDSLRMGWNWPEVREKLTTLVIVRTRTEAHSFRSQVGIGSESDCLLGLLDRISRISDSDAGVKGEKWGVVGEEAECGDDVLGLLERDRLEC